MEKFGTQAESRVLFGYEERKAVLQSSYGVCAHCGKKLTTKTMTIEHIIPLSRGGTNDPENLVALCYDCNQKKGNMLYLPYGFYSALRDKPRYHQMQELVADWFATVKDAFDMERFPLIAPQFWQQIEIRDVGHNRRRKPMPYIPSFQLRWEYVGNNLYDEVQAVTRVDIREERAAMNRLSGLPEDHPVALYVLKNPATDKLLALAGICYSRDQHFFLMDLPWMDVAGTYQGPILKTILLYTLDVLDTIYGDTVPIYGIASPYPKAFAPVRDVNNRCFGYSAEGGEWANRSTPKRPYDIARITRDPEKAKELGLTRIFDEDPSIREIRKEIHNEETE